MFSATICKARGPEPVLATPILTICFSNFYFNIILMTRPEVELESNCRVQLAANLT